MHVFAIMGKTHPRNGPRTCMDLEAAANIGEALSGLAIMFTLLFLSLIHISEPTRPY